MKKIVLVLTFLVSVLSFGQTAVYTITSTSAATQTGTKPTGSSHTYSQTFGTAKQMTSGNSTTLTLSGYEGYRITSIVLEMKSNTSAGAGNLSVVAGSTSIYSIATNTFANAAWNGAYTATYTNVIKTPTAYDIATGENVVIKINATTNSLYIQSYSITYVPAVKTVTFDANGGTGTMANQAANVATALTTNTFTRTGFNFTGWNTAADGSGTAYADGASYPFTADITLYAQWAFAGFTTVANGFWNVGTTWVGGFVPTASDNVIINHNVTLNGNVTRDAGTTTTVNAGKGLFTGAFTYTNNGATTIDGTLVILAGGYVNGTTDLVYGSAGALTINHNNGSTYSVSAGQRFWPLANPPFNVTISNNSPTRLDMVVGPVAGLVSLYSELNVATANALTVNGTLRIFGSGFINTNSPIYGASSTLIYSTGGLFNRGFEWRALGVGTIGTTPGYPNNLQIKTNTTLNYNNGTPLAKAIAGSLIIDPGSSFYMDYGGGASGGFLTIGGNVTNNGDFTLGNAIGDDLKIGGNFTNGATGVFNGNNRAVFFTKNGTQTITSTPALTIPYVVFEPVAGNTTVQLQGSTNLTIAAPNGGNAISFSNAGDVFDMATRTLTIGTPGVANVISGAGTFRGSTSAVLSLVGTGSIGTLSFSGTAAQQTVGTFTVDRTTAAEAVIMGSALTVATTMNLTAGIVDLNNTTFTLNAATTLSGASATNYFIADHAFGGILRKGYLATGSFTFPIGDKTGTIEYSPATFALTAGSGMTAASFIGMSVNDSKHPNMTASTDFISRYWAVTKYGVFNTPTYTVTGTYLPADINGTEANSLSQYWNSTAWSLSDAALGANTLIYGIGTSLPAAGSYDFTGGRREQEINIKQGVTTILSGGTYNFGSTSANTFVDATFTIENLGNANLTVYANPTLTGSAYSLVAPIITDIVLGSNGTATFTIRFNPLTAGTFTGSISFANTDSDENPYVINFTGIATGSNSSDIVGVTGSEPTIIPSTTIGTISTITDGVEAWRFLLRDGGTVTSDSDALDTILTDLILTQNVNDAVGNWNESIEDVVLVNLLTNTIVAHGVVTTNQIQFNTISVVAADNTQLTLGLRLTLKCPLGVGAIDGDDFGFAITNANTTFAPSGSGKFAFSNRNSANNRNVIAVVATKLTFTTQPITTGVSIAMGSVTVSATDACGNIDRNKTGSVSLTSSGTMNTVASVSLSSGVATFTGIIHTVVGTDFNLTANISGFTPELSTLFDISIITILNPGDLAVLAVNTNTEYLPLPNSGQDEVVFVCFRDLLPGTQLFITDNGYERKTAGLWGGTEGVITISRVGSILPKGTIITIRTTTANASNGTHFDVYTCGTIDSNWTKSVIGGSGFNLNGDDDIYFMQGGVWTNNTSHTSTYTGNVLYAWTESGWDLVPGGTSESAKRSTLYPGMECFSTIAPAGDGFVKFNDPVNPDFSTTTNGKFDWIALINNQSNWNSYSDNADYVANGYDYVGSCNLVNLATSVYVNGRWSGRTDTNWFNCLNWETLIVPDDTVDVLIPDTTYNREAEIIATAPFAIYSGYIAKAKNLTITGEKVVVAANPANVLEVHGNLVINGTGVLDMNDGNNATPDGTIHLYGNWTNSIDEIAFDQGNGTVHFDGTTPQVITAADAIGTEVFYNVILNNNFDTAISNNLIAQGNLTVNTTKSVTIQPDDYVQVNNRLQLNGSMVIENNGQLIQVNETDTNAGTYTGTRFQVKRTAFAKNLDYVYWSSPLENYGVSNIPNNKRFFWDPVAINANSTQGNWLPASGNMTKSIGYIARVSNGSATALPTTVTFQGGKPFNGQFNKTISRGTTTGINDCWNLVGNPYPSAIDADLFLVDNANIDGYVRLWMHGTPPAAIASPFYQNFAFNYTSTDYITYNGTATTTPAVFNGKIASGQGFFVRMLDAGESVDSSPTDIANITFKNEYRSDAINGYLYTNSEFFRNSNTSVEKSRIWMDLMAPNNQVAKTVIGYVPGATFAKDRLYDALIEPTSFEFYSLIDTQKQIIQGRPVPFDTNDQVPMGMLIQLAGEYTVAISAVDGLFSDSSQNIYLEDKYLNIIHDLRATPYTFTATVGTFDDRFVLRYTTTTLSVGNIEYQNGVVLFSKNGIVNAQSALEEIKSITLYDVLGRQIAFMDNVNATTVSIPTAIAQQTIIAKVILANGITVTKKIIL